MPTYEYKREDGTTFEIVQRITAPSLTECPTTGQKVKRIIRSGAGLVFKGSGFYQTDYVRKSGDPDSKPKSESKIAADTKPDSSKAATSKSDDSPASSKSESTGSKNSD